MSISDYLELQLLDAVFNADAFSVANVYCKLHIGDPGENGTANAAAETDRVEVTFGAAASGQVATDADATWSAVAADETVSHLSLWDHPTAGNCLWTGALDDPQALNAGGDFVLDAGDLIVQLA